jgi:hypothetical protein
VSEAAVSGTCELAPPRERLGAPRVARRNAAATRLQKCQLRSLSGECASDVAADTRIPRDRVVANAMADSEHAPMSEAIVGTATGQLVSRATRGAKRPRFRAGALWLTGS